MSVAVYNHYKRVYNNTTINKSSSMNHYRSICMILFLMIMFNFNNLDLTTIFNQEKPYGSDFMTHENDDLKLEKSNILLLGPTGSG